MTACLRISDFEMYLEDRESGAPVEVHVAVCEKCRAAFDHLAATHRRVNTWLSALASPMDDAPVDVMGALARVVRPQPFSAECRPGRCPWYLSLYRNVHELIRPVKLPPLNVTSRPVAVKEIWGLYEKDPKSRFMSMGIHAAVFALLMFGATNTTVRKSIQDRLTLVDPGVKPYVPEKAKGGGRWWGEAAAAGVEGGAARVEAVYFAADDCDRTAEAGDRSVGGCAFGREHSSPG